MWVSEKLKLTRVPLNLEEQYRAGCGRPPYLIWAGGLVDSARVFIMLLRLGLVRHTVGLVHGRHVVHQGDGLHSLVNSADDRLAHLGGCWSPGGWKVMGGLKKITRGTVMKTMGYGNMARVLTVLSLRSRSRGRQM